MKRILVMLFLSGIFALFAESVQLGRINEYTIVIPSKPAKQERYAAELLAEYLEKLYERLVTLTDVLGLIIEKEEEVLDSDIEKLIEERQAARKAKDFARADAIRDELLAMGIVLKDTREGVQWKRV